MNMQIVNSLTDPVVVSALQRGGIVVARTDTIYGILARASDEQAVEKVFAAKGRAHHKSPIVLISKQEQMFDTLPSKAYHHSLSCWPGKVTIATPCLNAPEWLKRGNNEFGYRLPDHPDLLTLIDQVGPLIAPSANPEGSTPAVNIDQAVAYFGDVVDVYVDGGEVTDNTPSQLLRVGEHGEIERLR